MILRVPTTLSSRSRDTAGLDCKHKPTDTGIFILIHTLFSSLVFSTSTDVLPLTFMYSPSFPSCLPSPHDPLHFSTLPKYF